MNAEFSRLSESDLRSLAAALRSRRLAVPAAEAALRKLIPAQYCQEVSTALDRLASMGLDGTQLAGVLDLLVRERASARLPDGMIDLVTTGPDAVGANRDTFVVVRELFAGATKSVLLAGYAIYQGQQLFQALAERMVQEPGLRVSMFLDIQRPPGDTSVSAELVRRFIDRFQRQQWPENLPLPEIFYDPRSLEPASEKRACLHAKCLVIDGEKVFVSSANFTEAAHQRNIEVGVLVRSAAIANQITSFFTDLAARGLLVRAASRD